MDQADASKGKVSASVKDYVDVIKSESPVDKTYIEGEGLPTKILYYCRKCESAVAPKRVGKKLSFSCPQCAREPIAFGTEKSVQNYYSVKQVVEK